MYVYVPSNVRTYVVTIRTSLVILHIAINICEYLLQHQNGFHDDHKII